MRSVSYIRFVSRAVSGALGFLAIVAAPWGVVRSQTPEWIWFQKTGDAEVRYFRKVFTVEGAVERAELKATADDALEVYLNGERVLSHGEWTSVVRADVRGKLRSGVNVMGIRARNGDSSPAGAIAKLEIGTDRGTVLVVTDGSWRGAVVEAKDWAQPGFRDEGWARVRSLGREGIDPWGKVFGSVKMEAQPVKRMPTPAEALKVPPGFRVELVTAAEPTEGSWVALTQDGQGRWLVSPQFGKASSDEEEAGRGLLRLTLGAEGRVTRREVVAKPLYDAQGLLVLDGVVHAVVNRYSTRFESGLYRIFPGPGDQMDRIEQVRTFPGGGEHGPHGIVRGPDGQIYIMCGNHTKVPDGMAADSPLKGYAEDHVLPRQWDGNGHAAGILAPGGYVLRADPEFRRWELFCGGFRNAYDLAFNGDGELFTYDSDMEWDWGMPWYRPTRVNQCVSGGDYGWRSGTGKWPDYYPDSLGAIDIGVGCPTGVAAGTGARFPVRYQKAMYIMDWTYGRLLAVHLTPDGAGYRGTYENFVCPLGLVEAGAEKKPLNLTDMQVGADGALYFTVGGRNTVSGLYRVTYVGAEPAVPAAASNAEGREARQLRRRLETYHGKAVDGAVAAVWPHLDSADRFVRYAARVALESQPVVSWQAQALADDRPRAALAGLLALARVGPKEAQAELQRRLGRFPMTALEGELSLEKLRVLQVSLARHGRPAPELARVLIDEWSPRFPTASASMNRELIQVLIALDAPGVVGAALEQMRRAMTQEEKMHYLFHLRTARSWTLDQRREYLGYWSASRKDWGHPAQVLTWFEEAGRPYADGASFGNFLKNFLREALENIPAADQTALGAVIETARAGAGAGGGSGTAGTGFPKARQRPFSREWTAADLSGLLDAPAGNRRFERGRQAFVDAQCLQCHKMGTEGGGVGPDLTALASRFTRRDMLESILDPSRVVSEQFQNTAFAISGGDTVIGRVVDESADRVVVYENPFTTDRTEIRKSEIRSRQPSKTSPMPEGLVNILGREELLDLLAFLEAGGRREHAAFTK